MINRTAKQKIELIINESLKFGRKTKFQYSVMFEEHRRLCTIVNLNETIQDKIKLFNNLDESSELYKSIYLTAKMALLKLQNDECYNFYSAELLMKMLKLESIFSKTLKSNGHKIIDISELKREHETIHEQQIVELNEIELNERREKFLSSNTTGKKFLRESKKRKEVVSALLKNKL